MAIFYVVGCAVLLVRDAAMLPDTIALIVRSAFSGHAAVGGFLGAGVREALRKSSELRREKISAALPLGGMGLDLPDII